MFEIKEKGSSRIVVPDVFAYFTARDGEGQSGHVSVHSRTVGRKFGIVMRSSEGVKVMTRQQGTISSLDTGVYIVSGGIIVAERSTNFQKEFTVGNIGDLYWSGG